MASLKNAVVRLLNLPKERKGKDQHADLAQEGRKKSTVGKHFSAAWFNDVESKDKSQWKTFNILLFTGNICTNSLLFQWYHKSREALLWFTICSVMDVSVKMSKTLQPACMAHAK